MIINLILKINSLAFAKQLIHIQCAHHGTLRRLFLPQLEQNKKVNLTKDNSSHFMLQRLSYVCLTLKYIHASKANHS